MENNASKGRGRPRKDVGLFVDAAQSKGRHDADTGNGQACAIGSGAQAVYSGTFEELVAAVKSYKVKYDSVAMAFHPMPDESVIETQKGWVRVCVGEAGFQTNSGVFVKL
jgi:hypothetical protein